jgi:hypothetical protein
MTLRACRVCGDWHRLEEDWPAECAGHFSFNDKRSDFATPMIISDTMGAIQSQLTGKYYDSKSSLRREYKAHGVTEIGNEKVNTNAPERPRITKQEIGSAIQKVAQGYKPAAHGVALAKETGANWH